MEVADANCPLVDLTLSGASDDSFDADTYTDGYKASITLTWGADYWTVMTDGTAVQAASFIARTDDDGAVTATATPYGAWFALQEWTVTDVTGYTSAGFFIPTATAAIASDTTGSVTLNGATDDKYGAATAVDVASDDQATGDSVTYSFLMPISDKDASAAGATSTAAGDRFDKGTTVAYYSSLGANTVVNAATACATESDKLEMGASALVAGSVAFAAALAF